MGQVGGILSRRGAGSALILGNRILLINLLIFQSPSGFHSPHPLNSHRTPAPLQSLHPSAFSVRFNAGNSNLQFPMPLTLLLLLNLLLGLLRLLLLPSPSRAPALGTAVAHRSPGLMEFSAQLSDARENLSFPSDLDILMMSL